MKITVTVETTEDYDGYDGVYTFSRSNMEDLFQISALFLSVMQAVGFDYVTGVGFEKDDGQVTFGKF